MNYRRFVFLVFVGILSFVNILKSWASALPAHDFHTSIAEMIFNSSSGSYEVSLRVFTDDFILGLQREFDLKDFDLKESKSNSLISKYIKKHFALVSGEKVKFGKYLGMESETDVTWLYIEFTDCMDLSGYSVFNEILMDQFSDQTNILNIKKGENKKTILFEQKSKSHKFPF